MLPTPAMAVAVVTAIVMVFLSVPRTPGMVREDMPPRLRRTGASPGGDDGLWEPQGRRAPTWAGHAREPGALGQARCWRQFVRPRSLHPLGVRSPSVH